MRKLNLVAAALMLVSFAGAADAKGTMKEACKADFEKFCKDAQKGARKACLQSHESELQPACGDALKASGAQKNG